jgi:hypothetical protein
MTAGPNDLTTVAAVQAYVPTAASDAGLLETLVTAESALIQSYLGYNIASQSWTEIRDGNGRDRLIMRNRPVSAVTSVVVDGNTIPQSAGWPAPGWSFDEAYIYLRGHEFRKGRGNVTLSYTAGYASVPADLAQAATELVAYRYGSRLKAGMGIVSDTGMQQTVAYSQRDMPASVMTALEPYRRFFEA